MTKQNLKNQLWFHFTAIIFIVMMTSAIIMALIAILLFQTGYLDTSKSHPLIPIFLILFVSVLLGTFIFIATAHIILRPITNFSTALREVAKGNFAVSINEHSPVSEINELNKHFNAMTKELSSIETLRNDFIVNVSHEFKTPLTAIEGYATLLQDDALTKKELKEYTEMIIEGTSQLSSLTGNILQLSRIENNNISLEKNTFRLDEQIRQMILFLEKEWTQKEITFDLELPDTQYYGNQGLLNQVWMNLLANAVKFSNQEGQISVSLETFVDYLTVTITDTGIGMSQDVAQKVFEKFYQGDTARKTTGNGLGLALVKEIISLSDGEISLSSEIGKGASFIVKLPIKKRGFPH